MSSVKGLGSLFDLIPGIVPLDLQTQRDGDYASFKNCQRMGVLIFKGAGTDGDDPTFTFQQASAVAGTGVKNLSVITEYYEKEGTLTSVGTWTRVTQAASHQIAPGDPSAQSQAFYYTEIGADELDVDNGFDCFRVTCSDVGTNAQLGCVIYIPLGLRYAGRPDSLPSVIAD